MNEARIKALGAAVLETEAAAVRQLIDRVDSKFAKACELMLACEGRIVVLGMGKSGHIGGKIAATLASTGTPAFFVHPGEASHGDLGMITARDLVLAISNSGETAEILTILPLIKRLGVPLISLTGNVGSTMAEAATVNLDVSVAKEACPLGLAPTASTTATLALGDALAVALLESRNFTAEDFARSHPGGQLGRRLLLHVGDIMRTGADVPRNRVDEPLRDVLVEMSSKGLGLTIAVGDQEEVLGVFTDGDLRRTMDGEADPRQVRLEDVMTRQCTTVTPDQLAAEALHLMEERRVNALPVLDENRRLVGTLGMHDLLRAGVA